jgi:hypothetical protein
MKKISVLLVVFAGFFLKIIAQNPLYTDVKVNSIYIEMPVDSFNFMFDNLVSTRYMRATFIFTDSVFRDTVAEIGIRLRGNTSLAAQKKSFKLSFNEFTQGGRYRGVKKLNLRASHVDPTLIREKLFYEVWKNFGMPERRAGFVKLFINGDYRGIYTNIEELDKEWLERVFPEKEGNFYKCLWPADFVYINNNPQSYKNIMHDNDDRAYDLTTNEITDDYTDLVRLIVIANNINGSFAANIEQVLNVNSVLKAFAIDVATGNWDDYFYNKNNYYLYHNLQTGKFEFITYDTDNTLGIDWVNRDWAKRNCLNWQKGSEPRPLATRLLAVPAYKQQFVRYLDSLVTYIVHPDTIFPRIDYLKALVAPAAATDTYRPLDFGYSMSDFSLGYTETVDGHTPYGIKPFLGLRRDSILAQISGVLSATHQIKNNDNFLEIYPNPSTEYFWIEGIDDLQNTNLAFQLVNTTGQVVWQAELNSLDLPYRVSLVDMRDGVYSFRYSNGFRNGVKRLIVTNK